MSSYLCFYKHGVQQQKSVSNHPWHSSPCLPFLVCCPFLWMVSKFSTFTTSAPYILTVAPVSFSNTHSFSLYRQLLPPHYSLTMSSLNLTVYRDSCLTSSDSLHVTTANKKSGIIVEHCPLPLCENLEPKMEFSLPNSKSAIKINFGLLKKIE